MLRIAKLIWLLSILSVLVIFTKVPSPFIEGPHRFFCTCVELALAATLLAWGFTSETHKIQKRFWVYFKHPISLAVTAFMLAAVASTVCAFYPELAFWSNLLRGDGLYFFLHLYAFFLLAGVLLETQYDWKWATGVFIASGVGVILWGLWFAYTRGMNLGGYFSDDPSIHIDSMVGRLLEVRFHGAIGNADFTPMYLAFAAFFSFYYPYLAQSKEKYVKYLSYGLTGFFGVFILLTQTRGIFVGIFLGVLAGCVALFLNQTTYRLVLKRGFVVLAGLGVLAFLLRNSPILRRIPGGRLLSVLDFDASSTERLIAWKTAFKIFLQHPICGVGFENFVFAWQPYFNPDSFDPPQGLMDGSYTGCGYMDRAHSVIFDYLTQTGLLGFIGYVSIFVLIAYFFVLKCRQKQVSAVESFLFVCIVVTYLGQGIFIFDTFSVYIGLFFFFAFFVAWQQGGVQCKS